MNYSIDYNINHVLFAVLLSFRLGALFMSMPLFSEVKITPLMGVILPISMAFLISPSLSYDIMPIMSFGVVRVFMAIVLEVLVGVIMGFALNIIVSLAELTGELTGMNAGLMMASFFDPNLGQMSLLGILLRNFLMLAFFLFNIHHAIIWGIVKSYEAIPVGSDFITLAEVAPALVKLFAAVFFMAFRLVLPIIVIILLSHLTMGIIQITAPQMNIYFNAAITLNIVVALFFLMLSVPTVLNYFGVALGLLDDFVTAFFVLT